MLHCNSGFQRWITAAWWRRLSISRSPWPVLPAVIAERGSTRTDFGGDLILTNALSLIRKNLQSPLKIYDLARSVGISRRGLYLRFEKHLGSSPLQEILRQRIAKAKSLLTGTTLPLAKIAELSGFGDPYSFSRAFRRETGMSPREHRQQHSGTYVG